MMLFHIRLENMNWRIMSPIWTGNSFQLPLLLSFLDADLARAQGDSYYGKEIGKFADGPSTAHGVSGTVYAIDNTRLWIKGFTYDGAAPGKVLLKLSFFLSFFPVILFSPLFLM